MSEQIPTVRARRFELLDATGRVRAVLAVRKERPYLAFLDDERRERISMGLDDLGSPTIAVGDRRGVWAGLTSQPDCTGWFIEQGGVFRANVLVGARGEILAQLADQHGHLRLEVGVDRFGRPVYGLHRRHGEPYQVRRGWRWGRV